MNVDTQPSESRELISIVSPAFNEEAGLTEFVRRIDATMKDCGHSYEIVFVNDGSTDNTGAVMTSLRAAYSNITVVNLTRNFGKEVAVTAGIAHATGDAVVIIDTDLQDPPEIIPELIGEWRNGYDMVYAQRIHREGETWLKRATAGWFYRVLGKTGPVAIPQNAGDFRLMSRRAADAVLQLRETHRFMKGLYAWIGFHHKAVPYRRHARHSGNTKWSYWNLWNLAIEGFTSFTIIPLKLATYLGLLVAGIAFIYGMWVIVRTMWFGDIVQGFPTLMVTILFLGGVQLVVLGVLGEYLGRVFNETKRRPLYLVEAVQWSEPACKKQQDAKVSFSATGAEH